MQQLDRGDRDLREVELPNAGEQWASTKGLHRLGAHFKKGGRIRSLRQRWVAAPGCLRTQPPRSKQDIKQPGAPQPRPKAKHDIDRAVADGLA